MQLGLTEIGPCCTHIGNPVRVVNHSFSCTHTQFVPVPMQYSSTKAGRCLDTFLVQFDMAKIELVLYACVRTNTRRRTTAGLEVEKKSS